jgi:tRNA (guanine-N7-)-methyltransferase
VTGTTEKIVEYTPRRLYGRSKGKALRRRQTELLADLLPRLACDLRTPLDSMASLFAGDISEIWLEIGFGDGEHLIETARRRPDVGLIGCEPFVNGMAKLLSKIDESGGLDHTAFRRALANIRLHLGDAIDVIDWLPPASLSRVFLLYPDPWPKRRHRKRRLVSPENLSKLARVMRSGAQLRFATDIDDYAGWALARIRDHEDFSWPARAATDWLTPWNGWASTKYETKAIAAGRKPVYLTFVRT